MARSDTRYSIYPAPRAVEIVGNTSPALNQAIECWAALLARALADNGKTFFQGEILDLSPGMDDPVGVQEWSLLADVLKEKRIEPDFANPCDLLATAIEDAHRLEAVGHKGFVWGSFDASTPTLDVDARIDKLVQKLRKLDYAHAWAVIVAVQWFWEHHEEGIDIKNDAWWTLSFHREWRQKHSGNKHTAAITKRQRNRKRRNKETSSN